MLQSANEHASKDTVFLFGYGDIYPLQDSLAPERIRDFHLASNDGERQSLTFKPGPFLATPVNFEADMTHLALVVLHPNHNTQVGDPEHHRYLYLSRDEVPADTPIVRSLLYHNYGKALIHVGTVETPVSSLATSPVGHTLEIILSDDPRQLSSGSDLTFEVLSYSKASLCTTPKRAYGPPCRLPEKASGRYTFPIRLRRQRTSQEKPTTCSTPPPSLSRYLEHLGQTTTSNDA